MSYSATSVSLLYMAALSHDASLPQRLAQRLRNVTIPLQLLVL